jgi:hypothetical protein
VRHISAPFAVAGILVAAKDATTTMIVRTGNGRHIYYRHPGGTMKNSVDEPIKA